MAIFEEESNASQDGNYREHLNRNWHNGNIEFADLRRLINCVYTSISSLWDSITGWTQQLNDLTRQINELNKTIEKQDARISKLEDAVFGLASADITTPPTPDYPTSGMVEINFDDRKDKKDKW